MDVGIIYVELLTRYKNLCQYKKVLHAVQKLVRGYAYMECGAIRKRVIVTVFAVMSILLLSGCCVLHEWSDVTCTLPKTCLKCEKTEGEPLGHLESGWIMEAEPTCIADGRRYIECTICAMELDEEILPAMGHVESDWITEKVPTCTEEGKQHKICARCNEIVVEETLNKLGHTESDWIVAVEASCTESGRKHMLCEVCGKKIQERIIPSIGHAYSDWIVDKEATCTKDGKQHRECMTCGEKETEKIIATGHVAKGINCSKCGVYTVTMNSVGTTYTDANGLSVTVNSYTKTPSEGYTSYTVSYTITNNVPDSKIMPGDFKLFFTDNTGEPQYGFFNYLYYGESSSRTYTWKVLSNQTVLVLEYNADEPDAGLEGAFFRDVPKADTMHWANP